MLHLRLLPSLHLRQLSRFVLLSRRFRRGRHKESVSNLSSVHSTLPIFAPLPWTSPQLVLMAFRRRPCLTFSTCASSLYPYSCYVFQADEWRKNREKDGLSRRQQGESEIKYGNERTYLQSLLPALPRAPHLQRISTQVVHEGYM